MDQRTRTPLIDGGIVNASSNTTATHDFAQPSQPSNTSAGTVGTGMYNEAVPTTERHHHPVSNNSATDTRSTGSKVKESASGAKGLVAAVHGAGETIRGNLNVSVDRAFHDTAGEAHNSAVASAGENEIATGQFSNQTKNREGVVPGADGDRRKNREFLSPHS